MQEKDHSWLWFVARLTGSGVLLVAVATVLSCFASMFWFADLFAHFRVQYCTVLTVFAVVLLAIRRWKLMAVCLFCLIVNGMPLLPYLVPPESAFTADVDQPTYRILSLNLLTSNQQYDSVRDEILKSQSDFVVLLETDSQWETALTSLSERYPYSRFVPQSGNFGIAFLSVEPWTRLEVIESKPLNLPSLEVEFEIGNNSYLQIIATHPIPPIGGRHTAARDEQLLQIANRVRSDCPALLVGDFNLTPWSPRFRQVLEQGAIESGGLTDAGLGFGVSPTWHVFPGLLGGLRLDHVLVNTHIRPLDHRITKDVGSDHRGVWVEFSPLPH